MDKLVIFGIGKIAEVVYHHIRRDSAYDVVAFTADGEFINQMGFCRQPVVPFEEITRLYPPESHKMLVAVGYQELNALRAQKYNEAKEKGYELISYVSSKTQGVGGFTVGDNCIILDNTIQPTAKIGNNVIMWGNNFIGHHASVGDHCFISAHVVISGSTQIEPYCFMGVNVSIGHEIVIGEKNFIGAGSIISKSTKPKSVFVADNTKKFRLDSERFLRFAKL